MIPCNSRVKSSMYLMIKQQENWKLNYLRGCPNMTRKPEDRK